MKTKSDAAKSLLAAGWTPAEINLVLGNVLELNKPENVPSDTPWWTWVGEEWYTGGTLIDANLEAWFAGR